MIDFDDIRDDGVTIIAERWFEDTADFWDHVAARCSATSATSSPASRLRRAVVRGAGHDAPARQRRQEFSVPVYSCGGFASLTAVRAIVDRAERRDPPTVFLHLGDFDPSGESIFDSMTEDAAAFLDRDRLLAVSRFIPERVAFTAEQVSDYDLPTAPPKDTDSRSARWSGETCQLEALPPDVLAEIVEQSIEQWMDLDVLVGHRVCEKADRTDYCGAARWRRRSRGRGPNVTEGRTYGLSSGGLAPTSARSRETVPSPGQGVETRVCEWCGSPIEAGRRRHARFCSGRCRRRAWAAAHEQPIIAATCEGCGELLTACRSDARWCSGRCRMRARRSCSA